MNISIVDEDYKIPDWMYWQNVIECCLYIVVFISALNAFIIFYKQAPFHKNLILLIINMYIGYCLLALTRSIICIASFYEPQLLAERTLFVRTTIFKYVEMVRVCVAFYSVSCLNSIMVERVIATWRLKSYEQSGITVLIPLNTIICWLIGACGSYFALGSMYTLQMSIIFMFAQLLIINCCFLYIWQQNWTHLRKSKRPSSSFSLSQRYQITENVRVIRIFTRCLVTFIFIMPLVVGVFTLSVLHINDSGNVILMGRTAVNLMTAILLLLLINIAITSTHHWRKQYKQNIRFIFNCFHPKNHHYPRKKSARVFVQNTEGLQLAFNTEDANAIYFNQLKVAWQ